MFSIGLRNPLLNCCLGFTSLNCKFLSSEKSGVLDYWFELYICVSEKRGV